MPLPPAASCVPRVPGRHPAREPACLSFRRTSAHGRPRRNGKPYRDRCGTEGRILSGRGTVASSQGGGVFPRVHGRTSGRLPLGEHGRSAPSRTRPDSSPVAGRDIGWRGVRTPRISRRRGINNSTRDAYEAQYRQRGFCSKVSCATLGRKPYGKGLVPPRTVGAGGQRCSGRLRSLGCRLPAPDAIAP